MISGDYGYSFRMPLNPERDAWRSMLQRCSNPAIVGYASYGGRGIKVCRRWQHFRFFLHDMGPRPSEKHSLDRIDVDGDYTPENCRWATREEQANNHRRTPKLTHEGVTLSVADWARRTGIPRHTIYRRLRAGYPIEDVLRAQLPQKPHRPHGKGVRHGLTGDPVYEAWLAMRKRCHNPEHPAYANYGGRGITVDPAWRDDVRAFMSYMGPKPSPKHSLDRIDNQRGYEPGNVRWATRTEQARNNRGNRLLTHKGVTRSLAEWADVLGVRYETLRSRLRAGWSVERAFGKRS